MEPFTFDQAVVSGLLFILGLLIGMFLLASPKWKRRYQAERARTVELERDVERLGRERQTTTVRTAADRDGDGVPDRQERGLASDYDRDGTPDVVDRQHVPRRRDEPARGWTPVRPSDRP